MDRKCLVLGFFAWALLLVVNLPVSAEQKPALQSAADATQNDGYGRMILEANLAAGDALVKSMESKELPRYALSAVPLADMDNPEETTPLGRLVSQQVGARLAQHGYTIIAQQEAQETSARAALTGHYQRGRDVYISLRVVRLEDNMVLAAYEYALPLNPALRRLLIDKSLQETWSSYVGRKQAVDRQAPLDTPAVLPVRQPMTFPDLAGEAELIH